ncbi:Uncharacterised protein [Salmonella enterica subsp. enterica serovar Typhi]|nr:Uncharacterised protein [Salmonella enterica subsp. enterica serovar Typhi]CGW95849.1 Uncharacterised protein [Salmonella enterica subsp. enterica serovar Typhi]
MTCGIETQINKEVFFTVIQQLLTTENFIAGGIDGDKFAIRIGGVQALCFTVERQTRTHFAGIFDRRFQFDGFAIHYPNSTLFTNTANVDRVGRRIGNQLTGL